MLMVLRREELNLEAGCRKWMESDDLLVGNEDEDGSN